MKVTRWCPANHSVALQALGPQAHSRSLLKYLQCVYPEAHAGQLFKPNLFVLMDREALLVSPLCCLLLQGTSDDGSSCPFELC